MGEPDIRIKRIYDDPSPGDGFRVLVDRIWPRGITKEQAALDVWMRDLAPSTELRKWFGHDPQRWPAFRERYRKELARHAAELRALRERALRERVTLLFGAKDPEHNQAVVLAELIGEAHRGGGKRGAKTAQQAKARAQARAPRARSPSGRKPRPRASPPRPR